MDSSEKKHEQEPINQPPEPPPLIEAIDNDPHDVIIPGFTNRRMAADPDGTQRTALATEANTYIFYGLNYSMNAWISTRAAMGGKPASNQRTINIFADDLIVSDDAPIDRTMVSHHGDIDLEKAACAQEVLKQLGDHLTTKLHYKCKFNEDSQYGDKEIKGVPLLTIRLGPHDDLGSVLNRLRQKMQEIENAYTEGKYPLGDIEVPDFEFRKWTGLVEKTDDEKRADAVLKMMRQHFRENSTVTRWDHEAFEKEVGKYFTPPDRTL